ncbi:hypothetical protein ACRAVF_02105 [Bradyrhizobium oligotrophicum S58]
MVIESSAGSTAGFDCLGLFVVSVMMLLTIRVRASSTRRRSSIKIMCAKESGEQLVDSDQG